MSVIRDVSNFEIITSQLRDSVNVRVSLCQLGDPLDHVLFDDCPYSPCYDKIHHGLSPWLQKPFHSRIGLRLADSESARRVVSQTRG
jgi:hypothetical protein